MRSLAFVFFLVFLQGCVSASKYDELKTGADKTEQALKKEQQLAQMLQSTVDEQLSLISQLEQKLGRAATDKESMRASITQMKQAIQEMRERKKEAEKRVREFEDLLRKFQAFIDAGAIDIKIVDGRMVVVLPSDVLFASGSSLLSAKGESAVKKITPILTGIEGKNYQVEGHTDNVPVKSKNYSNWQLAADRAINVMRMMIEAGLPRGRISAASFADTRPAADNSSKKGRKANRRIEIVIVPDLSSLPGYDELEAMGKKSL